MSNYKITKNVGHHWNAITQKFNTRKKRDPFVENEFLSAQIFISPNHAIHLSIHIFFHSPDFVSFLMIIFFQLLWNNYKMLLKFCINSNNSQVFWKIWWDLTVSYSTWQVFWRIFLVNNDVKVFFFFFWRGS